MHTHPGSIGTWLCHVTHLQLGARCTDFEPWQEFIELWISVRGALAARHES